MPIINRLERESKEREETLRDRIIAEITSPKREGEPIIAMEPEKDQPHRVTVIWDEWEGVGMRERSEIITDAIYRLEEAGTIKNATKLVVALGLTKAEARNLGFRIQQ